MSARDHVRRALVPFALTLAATSAIVAIAAIPAGHPPVADRNDTNGALDIEQVQFLHGQPNEPVWSVTTYQTWTAARMWDRGFVVIFLDTKWGEPHEYYALVRSVGTGMVAALYRDHADRDVFVATLPVWRSAADRVALRVPLRHLEFGPVRTFYRWHAMTLLTSQICPNVCFDRAPDEGTILQYRPGMSPTPTTTTPSPTTTEPTGTAPPPEPTSSS